MRRLLLPILVSLAGAALLGLLVYGISNQAVSRSLDEQLANGKEPPAPEAGRTLPRLGAAGTASLASYAGKVIVLNFWASWCEPCQAEAPLLEHAQASLERHGGTVLGVTYKDVSPDSESFVRQFHLTYPNLRDKSGEFAGSYGTDRLPESFIVNRSGRIVAISRGEIAQPFIEQAVKLAEAS
jgi:cytochrome c biogenesis protein CcmG/thiol:disulfide interchange protein DsbE